MGHRRVEGKLHSVTFYNALTLYHVNHISQIATTRKSLTIQNKVLQAFQQAAAVVIGRPEFSHIKKRTLRFPNMDFPGGISRHDICPPMAATQPTPVVIVMLSLFTPLSLFCNYAGLIN
ncbi:hypothetical protein ABEB36_002473 [Hypothenemus hampei]|uniref:Uncharacterized protein n=1 Tax=Hypothenemus hampei TaxID=57062 RepID=A0ABD1F5V7_HYPHA